MACQLGHAAGEQDRLVCGLLDGGGLGLVHALCDQRAGAAVAVVGSGGEYVVGDLGRVGDRRDWAGPGEGPYCPRAVLAARAVGVAVDLVEQVVVVLDGGCAAPVLDVGEDGGNVSDRDVE